MSTPINHHYVSQCQQKEFFNPLTQLIYVYDKELKRHYNKSSSKNLFSENHANSRDKNGSIDQATLEKELKFLIEDHYQKHLKKVERFIISLE